MAIKSFCYMRNVFMTFLDQNAPVNSLSFVCTNAQINQFLSLPAISCFAGCTYMWPLQIFCCICKVPGTFLNQNVSRVPKIFGIYAIDLCPKNPFFLASLSRKIIPRGNILLGRLYEIWPLRK